MHNESRWFLEQSVEGLAPKAVLDIGARDVNGTTRDLFPDARYVGLDIENGSNVDIVADAAEWTPDATYDIVICMSVLEHAPRWRDIITTAFVALRPGGVFVLTTVSDPFPAHSAGGGAGDQWYGNLTKDELTEAMSDFTIDAFQTTPMGDLLVRATR